MHPKPFVVAFAVVLVCSSVLAGAAAAQESPTAGEAANGTTTGEPTLSGTADADPMDVTSSPVPGFGAVTAVIAVAAAAVAARASSRR